MVDDDDSSSSNSMNKKPKAIINLTATTDLQSLDGHVDNVSVNTTVIGEQHPAPISSPICIAVLPVPVPDSSPCVNHVASPLSNPPPIPNNFEATTSKPLKEVPMDDGHGEIAIIGIDIDSICVSGNYLHGVLLTLMSRKNCSVTFNLLLNRLNFNTRTRFKLKPTVAGAGPKRRGKKMTGVNLDKFKNLKFCEISMANLRFHVMLYFVDEENIPDNCMLTDMQLGCLCACFNAAKTYVWDEIFWKPHDRVKDAAQYSIFKSKCTHMENMEVLDSTKHGAFAQTQSAGTLPGFLAHEVLSQFREHLETLSVLDPEISSEWDKYPYHEYHLHGCQQMKNFKGDLKQAMSDTAKYLSDHLFVHVQAVGVKNNFPNIEFPPVSLRHTETVDALVASGIQEAVSYLKERVLHQDEKRTDIIFSIDVAVTIRPLEKCLSYIPNGNVAAAYLKSLVGGHPALEVDPDETFPKLERVNEHYKCTDLFRKLWEAEYPPEDVETVDVGPVSTVAVINTNEVADEIANEDSRNSDTSEQGTTDNDGDVDEAEEIAYEDDDEDEDDDPSVRADMSERLTGLNYVQRLNQTIVTEMVDLADDPEYIEEEQPSSSIHDQAFEDDYVEELAANRNTYPQLCSTGYCGSAHTHQTLLECNFGAVHGDERKEIEIRPVSNRIYPTSCWGGQVYTPESMAFTRAHSRSRLYSKFSYFGIHVENILTETPNPHNKLLPDKVSMKEIKSTLDIMDNIRAMYKAGYSVEDRATSVRIEIFHGVTNLDDIRHTPVPEFPYISFINAFFTKHINIAMRSKIDEALDPLMLTFATPHPDDSPKDFHGLSSAAKVCLMYKTELLAQCLGIGCISSPILNTVKSNSRAFHFLEIGAEHQVEISPAEMLQTGLLFGVSPWLLTTRRFIPSALSTISRIASRLNDARRTRFNLYCVRLNQQLRNVTQYVELEGEILAVFRNATKPSIAAIASIINIDDDVSDVSEPVNANVPEFDECCVFDRPDYAALFALSRVARNALMHKIAPCLMKMYRIEWALNIHKKTVRFCRASETRTTRHTTRPVSMRCDRVPHNSSDIVSHEDKFGSFLKVAQNRVTRNFPTDQDGIIRNIGKCHHDDSPNVCISLQQSGSSRLYNMFTLTIKFA